MRSTLIVAALTASCAGAGAPRPTAEVASATGSTEGQSAQIAQGAKLYAKLCARCHGKNGEGKKDNPPVVGPDALPRDPPKGAEIRATKFDTAADVWEFVKRKMPLKKPGTLEDDEVSAVMAWNLAQNGRTVPDPLTKDNAKKIPLR